MQPTSEERLEIAARLRESREFVNGLPKTTPEQNAFDVFERILACIGYEHGDIFDYLADLIDCPMVSIEVNKHGRAYCPNCGCDDWCIADGSHYCPNCGVKVLDNA